MSWQAYVDESIRGRDYILCVSLVPSSEVKVIRRKVRALASPGQRRIHFSRESDGRRRVFLRDVAALGTRSIIYVGRHHDQPVARDAVLTAMVHDLIEIATTWLVLESRAGQDARDRSTIARAMGSRGATALSYVHNQAHEEPLLWVPDAVAWAWGRGGSWRKLARRLELIVEVKKIEVS